MDSTGITLPVKSPPASGSDHDVSFRDVEIDAGSHTIVLRRPLTLDLGAVAKGLAVDAAAQELKEFRDFVIDAGGDLYFSGCNRQGEPWSIGIRHPRARDELVERFRISDRAVCTSGDYERGRHILDARCGGAVQKVASATVIAPVRCSRTHLRRPRSCSVPRTASRF